MHILVTSASYPPVFRDPSVAPLANSGLARLRAIAASCSASLASLIVILGLRFSDRSDYPLSTPICDDLYNHVIPQSNLC
jgi:hypothetical protein